MKPLFDSNGHASRPGTIRCYYYDPVTGVHTGYSDEYIPLGVSLPGECTTVKPPEWVEGTAQVWDGITWLSTPDHRGTTVYSVTNGSPVTVGYLGDIREGFTTTAPATPFDTWDGSQWVTDTSAQLEQMRISLTNEANGYINSRQWPGKAAIGRLKGDELKQYNTWLDYLDAVTVSDGNPWPQRPAD